MEIFLIDDSLDDMEITTMALKSKLSNIQVLHFINGEEALEALRTGHDVNRIKLILTDLNLPGMSGAQLVKALRAEAKLKHLPIVVMSSSQDGSRVQQVYEQGANGYVLKPVGFENFMESLSILAEYWVNVNTVPHL